MRGVKGVAGLCTIMCVLGGCDRGDAKKDEPKEDKAESKPTKQAAAEKAEPAKAEAAPTEADGCAELTEAMVRSAVGLAKDVKVVQHPRKGGEGGCYYQWPNPDYDMTKVLQASAANMGKGTPPKMANVMDPEFQVVYLRGKSFPDADAAQKGFEISQRHLADTPDKDAEGKPNFVDVDGVGDAAKWTASSRHLSVRDGTRLFFVHLVLGRKREEEQAVAATLAKAIIAGA